MKKKEAENPEFEGVLEGLVEPSKEEKINLHAGHRHRVKQRFVEEGLVNFHDHQVLELLLFYAQPYKDVNELAHLLLLKFGSLSGVFEASVHDLMQVKGVGYNTAVLLSLVPGIVNRYQMDKWRDKEVLTDTTKMGQYVLSLFSGRVNEAFYIICVDGQNKVKSVQLVSEGTSNEVSVYPRMLVEAIIRSQGKHIILAHNHPSGILRPSKMDIALTKQVIAILRAISVKVLDHIIVGKGRYYSFAETGALAYCEQAAE
ncbi:MAG: DNA repair protein RadC [Peptococcaceae bacterium]|nr:DNA repair protein RadC [Peptococcaceae bacterium]